jgi:hypothetical protein
MKAMLFSVLIFAFCLFTFAFPASGLPFAFRLCILRLYPYFDTRTGGGRSAARLRQQPPR